MVKIIGVRLKVLEKTQHKGNLFNLFAPALFLVIWSGGALFSKLGLQYSNTWSFLFLRATLALVFLSLLVMNKRRKSNNFSLKIKCLTKSEIYSVVISGLLLQVCYLVFYFSAIKTQLSLGIIILILGVQPIITKLIVSKSINKLDIMLLGLCFLGLGIATLGYHKIEEINILGIIFAILALLSITFGTIIQSKVHTDPIVALLIQTLIAFGIFAVMTVFNGFVFIINTFSIISLIWMGAIVSVGAFLLLMLMLKYSSAEKVSTLFFLLPLLTMLLESLFFDTKLNGLTIGGDILVCVSLYMYQFKPFSTNK